MRFFTVLFVLFIWVSGYCDDALWRHLKSCPNELFCFLLQEDEVTEETERKETKKEGWEYVERLERRYTTAVGGERIPHTFRRPILGLKFSTLMPTSARTEEPNAGLGLGLLLRWPVYAGLPRLGRVELSSTFSITSMDLSDVQDGITYDKVYESYWDVSVCYLGQFIHRWQAYNMYWGVGFGICEETVKYKLSGSTASEDNSSALLLFKLGWDSHMNFYFEVTYRRLLDSARNISDLFEFSFGVYF